MEAIPLRIGGDKQQREIGWLFFVYCPANFALRSVQKTLEQPLGQSYNPTNLKRETLPVLGR